MPAIDRRRQLAAQEEQQRDRSKELIARRVEPRHQPGERRDAARRHHVCGRERVAQLAQARRHEVLALDAFEQHRQQLEIALGRIDARQHASDSPPPQ